LLFELGGSRLSQSNDGGVVGATQTSLTANNNQSDSLDGSRLHVGAIFGIEALFPNFIQNGCQSLREWSSSQNGILSSPNLCSSNESHGTSDTLRVLSLTNLLFVLVKISLSCHDNCAGSTWSVGSLEAERCCWGNETTRRLLLRDSNLV